MSKFKCVSAGEYDSTMECEECGYRYVESADARPGENEIKAFHKCPAACMETLLADQIRAEMEQGELYAKLKDWVNKIVRPRILNVGYAAVNKKDFPYFVRDTVVLKFLKDQGFKVETIMESGYWDIPSVWGYRIFVN